VIQLTPHMRVLVAVEPADFRRGIDGLAALCRAGLASDPFSGTVFVFRNRKRSAVKCLVFDGQGFWLLYKRMSKAKFSWWPAAEAGQGARRLEAHEVAVLLSGGDPRGVRGAEPWRRIGELAG
jgi:transposase